MDRKVELVKPRDGAPLQVRRVCAYARVSSGKDAMLHSLSAQISYYQRLIQSRVDWKYCGVYADEAQTGTKESREEFQKMIAECRKGNIDLIITKSISRFARNTVTLLSAVRELKNIGVEVYFEEQNIYTFSTEGEVMLTILASYAQEESLSVSENMLWRVKRNFEEGKPWGIVLYGYRCINGRLEIIPEEAEIVKRIFKEYLSGKGIGVILKGLNRDGVKPRRSEFWRKTSVQNILRDYNYTGNMLLQKTFRIDHISKKSVPNKGEKPMYHAVGVHEAIISMEMYNQVQEELERRAQTTCRERPKQYPFTSLILCPYCGAKYIRRHASRVAIWRCGTYMWRGRDACPEAKAIPNDTLSAITAEILGISDLTYEVTHDAIECIEAFAGNRLVFHLKNGEVVERIWQDRSRAESWTPEMKARAKQNEAERQMELKRRKTNA